ncbi:MAG: PAS domain S-box protein [Candidatus Thiodiazotropha lotti]|nr:PAS domain S-box protein [Candidatus Thiodiazotropha lotti]
MISTGKSFASETERTRHVLLLNSYHQSLHWEEEIYRAVKETLKPDQHNIELHVENMDTKRVPYTEVYRQQLLELFQTTYKEIEFDLIITSDNNAYDLMRNHRDALFAGVPFVFCGVNDFATAQLAGLSNLTGVAESIGAAATLEVALQLHPGVQEILVINDQLPTGKAWTEEIRRQLSRIERQVKIRYIGNWPMPRLLDEIRRLPQKSLILLGAYFRDGEERFFPSHESTQLIADASKVPVYSLLDFNLGHGIVGGNMISGYYQGRAAARMGLRILQGENPDTMPVVMEDGNRFMFDYTQLVKWGIDETTLPQNSVVVNRPFSFYQSYKMLVWITLATLLLLSTIIVLLLKNMLARRRAELALQVAHNDLERLVEERTQSLRERERDLRMLLEHIPLSIYYKDRDATYVTGNSNFTRDFDCRADELPGKTDFDLLPESIAREHRESDLKVMGLGETEELDTTYRFDGKTMQIHAIKVPVRDDEDKVVGLLGIYWDMTEQQAAKASLEESETRFRALFQESKAVQLIIDPTDGRIVDANHAAERYYGRSREALLSLRITDINVLSKTEVQAEMEHARKEEREHFFFQHRLANGDVRDVEVHSGPINLQGKALLYSIIHDVTERRKAEEALRVSEEKYRSLVQSVTSEYLVYRHDTHGQFTYVSPSVKTILGYEPQEFMHDYRDYLTPNPINEQVIASTALAIGGEKQPTYEVEMYTKSTRRCRLKVTESPLYSEDGKVSGVQGIAEDITEAWKSAMQLKARNRVMEMLNSKMSEDQILDTLVEHIEEIDPDALGSVLRLDSRDQTLHTVSAPQLPGFYNEAIEGLQIGDGVGACGTAAFRGETVITEDLLNHPYWAAYRKLVEKTPLRACWSQPIVSRSGSVLGTFAMYYTEPKIPRDDELQLIKSAADLAAMVMDTVRAEQSLREVEERQRLLLDSSTDGIFGLDLEGRTIFVNPAAAKMLGYKASELTNVYIQPLIHHLTSEDEAIHLDTCNMQRAAIEKREIHRDNEVLWRQDGSSFPVEYWSTPIFRDGQVIGTVVTFHDITERRASEERIEHMAFHDPLTDLPNRSYLLDRLSEAIRRFSRDKTPFALHLMDLDHFKDVNDSMGHPAGDKLLNLVSERLSPILRTTDTLARMGGDEFCIIQSHVRMPADAALLSQRIISAISEPFTIDERPVTIGTSIGIMMIDESASSPDHLLASADTALYKAKEMGRNQAVFYQDVMTRQVRMELELANHLPEAIQQGEIYLVYQPQMDLNTLSITGVEALVRWKHPQLGELMPDHFIGIAESRGHIHKLGEFILRSACKQAKQWRDDGLEIGRMAINFSALQLRDARSLESIKEAILAEGLPLKCVEIEVTESTLLDLQDRPVSVQIGCDDDLHLAIDDFGTGYSSLTYLKRVRAQKLKIDREFVADILIDPDDREIVKATIALGHTLNMKVVAEGIETNEQMEMLIDLGCRQGQGYLFQRPVDAETFTAWLKQVPEENRLS